jgi:hypothetical protein
MVRSASSRVSNHRAPLWPSFETARSLSSGAHSRDPLAPPQDEGSHFPVFTFVHNRLMMRWVAASRAWITNNFFCVASSG